MKDTITSESRLLQVYKTKEFESFKKYLINPRAFRYFMLVYRIKDLVKFHHINPESLAVVFNRMKERVDDNTLFYHPLEKKDTGVFSFLIGENRPFVLILPGGAYLDVCSLVEGFEVALKFNDLGYNAFIGNYSVGREAHYPSPMDDVSKMIEYIFSHSDEFHISTDNYGICGFSAGGHLASSWGTKSLGYMKYGKEKPGMEILCYPVITMGEHTNEASRKTLLKEDENNKDIQDKYSIETLVDSDYPKTYIWQCIHDDCVPFENSLMLKEALDRNGVKCYLKRVDDSVHGWGLGVNTPSEGWAEDSVRMWREND